MVTEEELKNLNSKQKLEYYAVKEFLEVYKTQRHICTKIIELSDNPDVKILLNNKIIGIEVAHAFYDTEEAKMLLGQKYKNYSFHEIMPDDDFVKPIQKILHKKSTKNYGKDTWLVIRSASPIFSADTLELYSKNLLIPENHFDQIWIVFNRFNTISQIQ